MVVAKMSGGAAVIPRLDWGWRLLPRWLTHRAVSRRSPQGCLSVVTTWRLASLLPGEHSKEETAMPFTD